MNASRDARLSESSVKGPVNKASLVAARGMGAIAHQHQQRQRYLPLSMLLFVLGKLEESEICQFLTL
ncbi:unnamed protein product [Calypogeia fissa]